MAEDTNGEFLSTASYVGNEKARRIRTPGPLLSRTNPHVGQICLDDPKLQNILFEDAIENMDHGLSIFDRHNRLMVANKRFAEMYSLPWAHSSCRAFTFWMSSSSP